MPMDLVCSVVEQMFVGWGHFSQVIFSVVLQNCCSIPSKCSRWYASMQVVLCQSMVPLGVFSGFS